MKFPNRAALTSLLAIASLWSSLAVAQTTTITSPAPGELVDIPGTGQICVTFDYDWFPPLGYGPTAFTLYVDNEPQAATCDPPPNPLSPRGVGIKCCYAPPPEHCAPVFNVLVHRCPPPATQNIYSPPVQAYIVDYQDPGRAECVPSPPRCEQELCGAYRGKPVDVTTGNVYYEAEDAVIPVDIPVVLGRRYDSMSRDRVGDFGSGFRHAYEDTLECTANGNRCTYTDSNNQSWTCGKGADFSGGYFHCNAPFLLLDNVAAPYDYAILFPDDTYHYFGAVTFNLETKQRLRYIEDSRGHSIRILYGEPELPGRPDTVEIRSHYGHSLFLNYGGGKIDNVERQDDEFIEYNYLGDRLQEVRYPLDPIDPMNDFVIAYNYDDPGDPNLLTSVTDSAGHVLEAWEYDPLTRQATSYYEEDAGLGPVNALAFQYDNLFGSTIVVDAFLATTTYDWSRYDDMLQFIAGPNPNGPFPDGESMYVSQDSRHKRYSTISLGGGEQAARTFDSNPAKPSKWWNVEARAVYNGESSDPEAYSLVETCYDDSKNVPLHIVIRTRKAASATCTPPPMPGIGVCLAKTLAAGEMGIMNTIDLFGKVTKQTVYACQDGDPVTGPVTYSRDFTYDLTDHRLRTISPIYNGVTPPPSARPIEIDYHQTLACCRGWLETVTVPVDANPANDLVTTFDLYDDLGNLLQVTDPNGVVIRYYYDLLGRLTDRYMDPVIPAEPLLHTEYSYHDHSGQLARVDSPESREWFLDYDTAHRPTAVRDAVGNKSLAVLDQMSRVTDRKAEDPLMSLTWQRGYTPDDYGRVEAIAFETSALPRPPVSTTQTIDLTYHEKGTVATRTDPAGHYTAFDYPSRDRHLKAARHYDQDPLTGGMLKSQVGYLFDFNGLLDELTDANALGTTFDQSDLGPVISKVSSDGGPWSFAHDAAGNLASVTDARGIQQTRTYDLADRLTAIHYPDSSEDVTLSYDSAAVSYGRGRLTGVAGPFGTVALHYDREGRIVKEVRTGSASGTTEYGYDKDGNLTSITYPLSGLKVYYDYDGAGRVSAVRADLSPSMLNVPVAGNITYAPFGPVTAMALGSTPGGMIATRHYDTSYALLDQQVLSSTSAVVLHYDYGYDEHGFLNKVADNLPPGSGARDFGYDPGHRLTTANAPMLWGLGDYTYDANGNVTAKGFGPLGRTFQYDPTQKNRLVSTTGAPETWGYDANGNVTSRVYNPGGSFRSYTYNDANRLESVSYIDNATIDSVNYTYDHLGRVTRAATPVSGDVQTFFYTLGWNLLDEQVTGPTGATSVSYIWLGSTPIARVDSTGGGPPTLSFYHSDHLGTPVAITDGTGNFLWRGEYDPYGGLVSSSGSLTNRLRFPGQFADGTFPGGGIYHNGFRVYDPAVGRYLAVDAVSSGYPTMHSWSPYGYAGGESREVCGSVEALHICRRNFAIGAERGEIQSGILESRCSGARRGRRHRGS